jgi:AAA family ATP:ADP antiporter
MAPMQPKLATRVLSRLVAVRPEEMGALLWAFAGFFCLLCGYYLLRPLRDAMGIEGGEKSLPWLFSATFLTMLGAVPLYAAVVSRARRTRIVPLVYRFFAANLLLFFLAAELGVPRPLVGKVFFVWTSVYNLFVVSIFWSLLADVFDGAQAKRLFGFVAGGGSAGGIVGLLIVSEWAPRLGKERLLWLLVASALTLETSLFCLRRVTGQSREREQRAGGEDRVGGSLLGGVRLALGSPYLLGICLLVLFLTSTATFLYMQRASLVARATVDAAARTALFARVDLGVNVVAIALQVLLTGRLLSRLGLSFGLGVLPLVCAAGFFGLSVWPSLTFVAVLEGARRAIHYAIERPAREVLFTAVDREAKYKAKSFIDTVVYRGGDALSSRAYEALVGAGLPANLVALAAVPLSALWFVVAILIARRHRVATSGEGAVATAP